MQIRHIGNLDGVRAFGINVAEIISVKGRIETIAALEQTSKESTKTDGTPFAEIERAEEDDVNPFPRGIESLRKVDHAQTSWVDAGRHSPSTKCREFVL